MSRLSQALSEGDGITILVEVAGAAAAGAAEGDGADALAVRRGVDEVRASTQLPVLALGGEGAAASDAAVVAPDPEEWERVRALGVECVVRVTSADELERALDELDPELFLLALEPGSDDDPLETLLALLHDVPAGKLAIAELADATADEVAELERAGVDGVLVQASHVTALAGAQPPEVP